MSSETSNLQTQGSVRVDKWLWAARCFKTRSQATKACSDGLVSVNGEDVKASAKVKAGDQVRCICPGHRLRILEVVALAEKRGSAEVAAELFVDHSPPPPEKSPRDEFSEGMHVERGQGRPSKRDRRRYDSMKGW
jgi:ribosome-associated heat shock protein Hsp15